jgi:hypothetical protein
MYSRKDIGAIAFATGLLAGLLIAFASCTPNPDEASQHITTGAHQ